MKIYNVIIQWYNYDDNESQLNVYNYLTDEAAVKKYKQLCEDEIHWAKNDYGFEPQKLVDNYYVDEDNGYDWCCDMHYDIKRSFSISNGSYQTEIYIIDTETDD